MHEVKNIDEYRLDSFLTVKNGDTIGVTQQSIKKKMPIKIYCRRYISIANIKKYHFKGAYAS